MRYAFRVVEALRTMSAPYALVEPTPVLPACIVFSGTGSLRDVFDDLQIQKHWCGTSYVHAGFAKRARRCMRDPPVEAFVQRHDRIVFGGYSLGGAVAVLAAHGVETQRRGAVERVYTFGAPAVGDADFCAHYAALDLERKSHRVRLSDDVIPRLNFRFEHVGRSVVLDYDGHSVIDNHSFGRYHKEVMRHALACVSQRRREKKKNGRARSPLPPRSEVLRFSDLRSTETTTGEKKKIKRECRSAGVDQNDASTPPRRRGRDGAGVCARNDRPSLDSTPHRQPP